MMMTFWVLLGVNLFIISRRTAKRSFILGSRPPVYDSLTEGPRSHDGSWARAKMATELDGAMTGSCPMGMMGGQGLPAYDRVLRQPYLPESGRRPIEAEASYLLTYPHLHSNAEEKEKLYGGWSIEAAADRTSDAVSLVIIELGLLGWRLIEAEASYLFTCPYLHSNAEDKENLPVYRH
ncbi:hypothetical protein V8C37DRAFT_419357 [Trichoderma ceciliae]